MWCNPDDCASAAEFYIRARAFIITSRMGEVLVVTRDLNLRNNFADGQKLQITKMLVFEH